MAKQWMARLHDEQEEFVNNAIKESKANGSVVIRKALDIVREHHAGDFINALKNARMEEQLRRINEQKRKLEVEEKALKQALKS